MKLDKLIEDLDFYEEEISPKYIYDNDETFKEVVDVMYDFYKQKNKKLRPWELEQTIPPKEFYMQKFKYKLLSVAFLYKKKGFENLQEQAKDTVEEYKEFVQILENYIEKLEQEPFL